MSEASSKIIPFTEAASVFAGLREKKKKVVLCHGLFELIHAGHIAHLEEARALGDVLVVAITADKFVNKGPGRPMFKAELRARTLAMLHLVDYIVIDPHTGAAEAILAIRPNIYCRGKAEEKLGRADTYHKKALAAVEKIGGKTVYVGGAGISATKLMNHHFDHLPADVKTFCSDLARNYSGADFSEVVESLSDLKVLVMGDTIFDRYSYLKVQGLTSKNRIISGRFLREETQLGGALAVFRHIKQFTPHVSFLSLLGTEPWVDPLMREHLTPAEDKCVRDAKFTTIIKQRYVEPLMEGKEMSKLFSVNYINSDAPSKEAQAKLEKQIRAAMAKVDLVVLLDFGHGMMQPQLRKLVQDEAPFLALNCQTNSNNHGFNIISRQYQRTDMFALDEQEMLLAAGHRHLDFPVELNKLKTFFKAKYGWLTRGAVQTIGLSETAQALCPPLESDIVDTIGAGDAFFSVASLAAVRKFPIPLATFLGQLAGGQAVKIVGNAQPISKQTLLNSGMSLLNF